MGADAPLRQPIPLARSILWIPANAGGGGDGGGGGSQPGDMAFPIFLAQAVLQAIHEHLAAPWKPGQGLIGFLVGDLCECPETNASYLIIDSALRLGLPIYGDRTMDVVTRLWDRIEAQVTEQKGHLIGWYHTHPPHPIALSEHDLETHEHYFAEPWQIALIVGTGADGTEPAAGLFRASSDETWPTTQLPFYELLDEESPPAGGKPPSLVAWKNYRAHDALADRAGRTAPKAEPADAAAPAPPHPELTPEPPPPRPATPPPAPPDPPAPAKSDELVFLTAAQDFASPPPPRPPVRAPRPEPPAAPRRATPPPPPPTAEEPVEEPFRPPVGESGGNPFDAPREESVAVEQPRPPRAPPVRRRRRKRRRGIWVAAFGILLVGAGAGLYLEFRPSLPSLPTLPKLPSLPWPKRQATAPPAASRPSATASQRQPVTPLARLDRVGDSLAQAVRTFGGRAALFDRRQLACDGLARGLRAVEDRWMTYSAVRRASGVLDGQHAVRDQMLYAGVDSVERRFEQSGCVRP